MRFTAITLRKHRGSGMSNLTIEATMSLEEGDNPDAAMAILDKFIDAYHNHLSASRDSNLCAADRFLAEVK